MRRRERKRQEKREDSPILKEAACYPSAVVQGASRRKTGLCEGGPG